MHKNWENIWLVSGMLSGIEELRNFNSIPIPIPELELDLELIKYFEKELELDLELIKDFEKELELDLELIKKELKFLNSFSIPFKFFV